MSVLRTVRDRLTAQYRSGQMYTAALPELREIASELSDDAGTVVFVEETHSAHGQDINVTVTFSFTLDADTAKQVF